MVPHIVQNIDQTGRDQFDNDNINASSYCKIILTLWCHVKTRCASRRSKNWCCHVVISFKIYITEIALLKVSDPNPVSDLIRWETVVKSAAEIQVKRVQQLHSTAIDAFLWPTITWIIGTSEFIDNERAAKATKMHRNKNSIIGRHSSLTVIIDLGHNQMHSAHILVNHDHRYCYVNIIRLLENIDISYLSNFYLQILDV